MVGSEKSRLFRVTRITQHARLSTLATDSSGQLDVFRHDGDSLGVDGAQVRIFEKTDQVCLASLLQGHDGRALETQIGLEVLCDFTDQALEGQLADKQLGALLVTTDLTKSDGAGPVAMRLLHSPVAGALLRAALVASCFLGALPPVDLRAVCLVRAMITMRVLTANVSGSKSAPSFYCVAVACWRQACVRLLLVAARGRSFVRAPSGFMNRIFDSCLR